MRITPPKSPIPAILLGGAPREHNDENTGKEASLIQEQTIIWICSIISAVLAYCVVAFSVFAFYHPNTEALRSAGEKLLINYTLVRPEPMEAMLARMAIVTIPLGLTIFYSLFSRSRIIRSLNSKALFNFLTVGCVIFIVWLLFSDFLAPNPFGGGMGENTQTLRDERGGSNFDFYFGDLFIGSHPVLYSFVLFPLVAMLFLIGFRKFNLGKKPWFARSLQWVGNAYVGVIILTSVVMCTFTFPYGTENKYDFGAVYYSMTQVYSGAPMLVNGFTNTYGLYPHFLNPLFHVIGLSILKFSLVMSLLLGLAFAFNFYCLGQLVRNKLILYLGMSTVLFFSFFDFKFTENFDAVFALYSIRYIIPSTLILLSMRYLQKRSNFIYWTTTTVMAIFVLWNPEFGIVSYVAWFMLNTFVDFYLPSGKPDWRRISLHWAAAVAVLIGVIYLFKFLVFLFYGNAPDMALLWSAVLVFGKIGFNMLPMALLHPWNVMVLVLILGFVYAISHWYKRDITTSSAMVFLFSVLGTGIFLYFQGRSHNWNFAMSSGIAIILLTVLGDKLWTTVRSGNFMPLTALFIVFLYVISFSVFEIPTNSAKVSAVVFHAADKKHDSLERIGIGYCKDFISANTRPNEKIHVFTLRMFQSLFFDNTERISAFNPGIIDMFFKADLKRLENQLIDSSNAVFMTPSTFGNLDFMSRPLAAVAATYDFAAWENDMICAKKRKIGIPTQTFFGSRGAMLIHRKYTNDRAGAQMRIDDAFGIKTISLDSVFSVEVLFKSTRQVFPLATLVGNSDSAGVVIGVLPDGGLFAINGKGYKVKMPKDQWVYCVMNVNSGRLEIYENGERVCAISIAKLVANTNSDICVGNLGYMHYYVGAISEVAISNRVLDSNQVTKTWNEIQSVITRDQEPEAIPSAPTK